MASEAYRRPMFRPVLERLQGQRRFIQILSGPRQVGKTTLARQVIDAVGMTAVYATADDPAGRDATWLRLRWEEARFRAGEGGDALLVLDEVQKIPGWADLVKLLWDEDSASRVSLRVLLLGSSPLMLAKGLADSLAGRFERIRVPHWSFPEMREAFGWDVDRYVFFGGYPGSAPLVGDERRWRDYILDSLVETSVSRDILLLTRVDKPALLRQVFRLACEYSGQVLSYTKMLGQLQEAGNTTTVAHYLQLLGGAGMVTGLSKFSGSRVRQRGSSPKLQVLNTALMTASFDVTFTQARREPELWGGMVESSVGAHLVNSGEVGGVDVFYWRDKNREVDFVLADRRGVVAIEVTSGRRKSSLPGIEAFRSMHRVKHALLVGGQGIDVEEFLSRPAEAWLG